MDLVTTVDVAVGMRATAASRGGSGRLHVDGRGGGVGHVGDHFLVDNLVDDDEAIGIGSGQHGRSRGRGHDSVGRSSGGDSNSSLNGVGCRSAGSSGTGRAAHKGITWDVASVDRCSGTSRVAESRDDNGAGSGGVGIGGGTWTPGDGNVSGKTSQRTVNVLLDQERGQRDVAFVLDRLRLDGEQRAILDQAREIGAGVDSILEGEVGLVPAHNEVTVVTKA